jgi:hypothetical protein
MTKDQFLRNNRGIDKEKDVDRHLLENIYDNITANQLITKEDLNGNLFADATREGYMYKQGGSMSALKWKRRYFIVSQRKLFYFESDEDLDALGYFVLNEKVPPPPLFLTLSLTSSSLPDIISDVILSS